jgi:DNA-binding response OmpR family regulator
VLLARQALAHGTGTATSPCLAALLRDLERASLGAGPAVRRIYSVVRGDALLAQIAPIGFAPLRGREVIVGGRPHRATLCDLGPESVAGWVSRLAADDPAAAGAARLDGDARELVLDGRAIALTKLECDVLAYLREHEGRPVTREALLRDVWGYEWSGGSNVVEVAVSGLRRKLGSRAGALETVRGVGYRLREL